MPLECTQGPAAPSHNCNYPASSFQGAYCCSRCTRHRGTCRALAKISPGRKWTKFQSKCSCNCAYLGSNPVTMIYGKAIAMKESWNSWVLFLRGVPGPPAAATPRVARLRQRDGRLPSVRPSVCTPSVRLYAVCLSVGTPNRIEWGSRPSPERGQICGNGGRPHYGNPRTSAPLLGEGAQHWVPLAPRELDPA